MNSASARAGIVEPHLDQTGGLLIRRGHGELDYQTWKRFIEGGEADAVLDPVLLNSWRRCTVLGVDPVADVMLDYRSPNNQFEAETLLSLADRLDPKLLALTREKELVLAVTDARGRFVYRDGGPRALDLTTRLGFVVDADWTEGSVGTNAVGTALVEGFPVQIFGREHFRASHQSFRCTAAPFFSPSGQIMGCVDLSSGLDVDHAQNLELVIGIARFFERVLLQTHAREMQAWPAAMLGQLGGDEAGGLLVVEAGGLICGLDDRARQVLGRRAEGLAGRRADEVFDLTNLKRALPTLRPNAAPVFSVRTHATPVVTAEARPLWSPSGLWLGILLRFQEPAVPHSSMSEAVRAVMRRDAAGPGVASPWVFLGASPAAEAVRRQAAAFAQTPSTVLITGESGSGKERVARALHAQGPRGGGPFIPVNCGAFPEELIQSELFGYAPGAFTGADRRGRAGLFERADGGVLFLDEIGELPLRQQANLLRVLEDRRVTRVGGNQALTVNVKIVAATNRDLEREAVAGRFREDLYHRLNVMVIDLPPLRARTEDILPIAEHHLARLAAEMDLPPLTLGPDVRELFLAHQWPGNVRTLINALEYACNRYFMEPFEEMAPGHLPEAMVVKPAAPRAVKLESAERAAIAGALEQFEGNISRAAKALGIGRNTLYAKMKKMNLGR